MTPRLLPILNAIGCLAITGLVVTQWRAERASHAVIDRLRSQLAASRLEAAEESRRRSVLERDISVLKEALESTQKAAESAARDSAENQELAADLQTEIASAKEQITAWEAAIQARDERIRSLDADLAATRKRLDEAIAKLNQAGAR